MSEQTPPDIKKHSAVKAVAKRIAPIVVAGIAALTPGHAYTPENALGTETQAPLPVISPAEQVPIMATETPLAIAEKERQSFTPSVIIIDAGLFTPKEGIIQNEFFSNEELAKRLLGSIYLSQEELTQEFGSPIKPIDMGIAAVKTGKYKQILAQAFIERYFGHGDKVIRAMEESWNQAGLQSTGVELLPLQKILDTSSIKGIQDSLGNQGISISFDPQHIIALLKTDTNRVVNMSFQVGDVDIFLEKKYIFIPEPENIYLNSQEDDKGNVYVGAVGYVIDKNGKTVPADAQGKEIQPITPDEFKALRQQKIEEAKQKATIKETDYPQIKIVGAYDAGKAQENLPKLFAVANAYPDKLFFTAAGNEGEDFEEALNGLKDQRPNNLIIVGQWTENWGPTQRVFGADIYINNARLGISDGSSFSTPVLSAYAETLLRRGLSQDEVLTKIKTNSHQEEYDLDLSGFTRKGNVMVFDPNLP